MELNTNQVRLMTLGKKLLVRTEKIKTGNDMGWNGIWNDLGTIFDGMELVLNLKLKGGTGIFVRQGFNLIHVNWQGYWIYL